MKRYLYKALKSMLNISFIPETAYILERTQRQAEKVVSCTNVLETFL